MESQNIPPLPIADRVEYLNKLEQIYSRRQKRDVEEKTSESLYLWIMACSPEYDNLYPTPLSIKRADHLNSFWANIFTITGLWTGLQARADAWFKAGGVSNTGDGFLLRARDCIRFFYAEQITEEQLDQIMTRFTGEEINVNQKKFLKSLRFAKMVAFVLDNARINFYGANSAMMSALDEIDEKTTPRRATRSQKPELLPGYEPKRRSRNPEEDQKVDFQYIPGPVPVEIPRSQITEPAPVSMYNDAFQAGLELVKNVAHGVAQKVFVKKEKVVAPVNDVSLVLMILLAAAC